MNSAEAGAGFFQQAIKQSIDPASGKDHHSDMKRCCWFLFVFACTVLTLHAQAPGVPIEEPEDWSGSKTLLRRAAKLREAGKLTGMARFVEMLAKPTPEKVVLPPAKTTPLSRPEIYELARRSRVRIGWYYLCRECSDWHLELSGGYPLTDDGVIATCHHVVTPTDDMKEGYLIVVDADGKVSPVTGVIAANGEMDTCLLRTAGGTFQAMPLNDQVRPGDAAYCLSDPLGYNGYFSEGMVNRFYRMPEGKGTPDEALRLNVSTDWAPGSSGSPVLDQCGNVIGHVSTIAAITEEPEDLGERAPESAKSEGKPSGSAKPEKSGSQNQPDPAESEEPLPPGTQIVLHEASASRGVMQLLKAAADQAKQKRP